MSKKNKTLVSFTLVILIVLILVFIKNDNNKSIKVLSAEYGGLDRYYLYVPGKYSTCNWSFLENGEYSSFTSYPDQQTNEHYFFYNNTISNTKVTCLNSEGIEYQGIF